MLVKQKPNNKGALFYRNFLNDNFDEAVPENEKLESVIVRDLKLAYGMTMDLDFVQKIVNLKVIIVELNDLRGSDRESFPKTIALLTKNLSVLKNLVCVELT
jgi:hypothetical protein